MSHLASPLTGLQIVDTTTFIAGPSATLALAQLGADVFRIDPLTGASDAGRLPLAASGQSLYWTNLNRGKRSLTINTRSDEGRGLLARLVAVTDGIYVTNAVGDALVTYSELVAHRPDVIMIHLQGMPDARPAVDYTVARDIGVAFGRDSEGNHRSLNNGVPAWDLLCGAYAALAVLVAERQRHVTGRGQLVEVALWDVAVGALGSLGLLAEQQVSASPPRVVDGFVYGTFGTDFVTKDGQRVFVVALTTRMWRDLVELTGVSRPVAVLEDALGVVFDSDTARYQHRETLAGLMRDWFTSRTVSEISASLAQTRIQWRMSRSLAAFVDHLSKDIPAIAGMVEDEGIGTLIATRSPLRFSDASRAAPQVAPKLGGHNASTLVDLLSLSESEIHDLCKRGVIGGQEF